MYPKAILVSGSDFLDCQGIYYITYETSSQTSHLPVYKSLHSDRYIYYSQTAIYVGQNQPSFNGGWRIGKKHNEGPERVFYASKYSRLPNKRRPPNKHRPWKSSQKQ